MTTSSLSRNLFATHTASSDFDAPQKHSRYCPSSRCSTLAQTDRPPPKNASCPFGIPCQNQPKTGEDPFPTLSRGSDRAPRWFGAVAVGQRRHGHAADLVELVVVVLLELVRLFGSRSAWLVRLSWFGSFGFGWVDTICVCFWMVGLMRCGGWLLLVVAVVGGWFQLVVELFGFETKNTRFCFPTPSLGVGKSKANPTRMDRQHPAPYGYRINSKTTCWCTIWSNMVDGLQPGRSMQAPLLEATLSEPKHAAACLSFLAGSSLGYKSHGK